MTLIVILAKKRFFGYSKEDIVLVFIVYKTTEKRVEERGEIVKNLRSEI